MIQISMTVIPIHVRTEERVKISSMDTDVSVHMIIQEHSARLVSLHFPLLEDTKIISLDRHNASSFAVYDRSYIIQN